MVQGNRCKCCIHSDLLVEVKIGLPQVVVNRTLVFVQSVQSIMRKKSTGNNEPWRTVKNGSVEVVIYEEKAGYRAAWYFAGSRERKFFTKSAEAVEFAKEKAFSLSSGQSNTEAENDAKLKYLRHLEQRMGDTPVHVAVDDFLWRRAKAKMDPQKTGDLLTAFLSRLREDKKSPSYIKAVKKYVNPFTEKFPGLIHKLTSTEIDTWIRERSDSPHTRSHTASYLKTFFNWSRDVKKALPQGGTEADLVSMPDPKPDEIKIYTPKEMRLMFHHAANDEERALLALGGFVGLRNSEITGENTDHPPLPIENIFFDEAQVKVVQKVQRKSVSRYAPIPANALTWLDPLREKTGPVVSFSRADRVIVAIIDRVNVAHSKDPGWKAIKAKRNGLRRSHISYKTATTRDIPRVADECNTSAEKIRSNYRKPGLESEGHKWYAISRL